MSGGLNDFARGDRVAFALCPGFCLGCCGVLAGDLQRSATDLSENKLKSHPCSQIQTFQHRLRDPPSNHARNISVHVGQGACELLCAVGSGGLDRG